VTQSRFYAFESIARNLISGIVYTRARARARVPRRASSERGQFFKEHEDPRELVSEIATVGSWMIRETCQRHGAKSGKVSGRR